VIQEDQALVRSGEILITRVLYVKLSDLRSLDHGSRVGLQ
jgi:hypothetical protein